LDGSAQDERSRILAAMLDLVVVHGYAGVRMDDLLERAGVDRAAFERHFEGLDDCFFKTYENGAERYDGTVFGAYDGDGPWRDRLRAAAYAGARWLRDHPKETRLGTVEMLRGPHLSNVYLEKRVKGYVRMIDDGRGEMEDPDALSPAVAEAAIGSIVNMLMKRLNQGGVRGPRNWYRS
jgi:AcrR family transcriptional regulator